MVLTKENYLVDAEGQRVGVLLDIENYRRLVDAQEELQAIRAYDVAKASGEQPVPFERAVAEIEKTR